MSDTNGAPSAEQQPAAQTAVVKAAQPKDYASMPAEVLTFEMQQRAAAIFAQSGIFQDIKGESPTQSIAKAFVKISLGASMGFSPAESMMGIDMIQGRPSVGAQLRAARMAAAGYSWPQMTLTEKGCWMPLCRNGKPIMSVKIGPTGQPEFNEDGTPKMAQVVVSYTEADAQRNGLLSKDNWKKNPRNMFFARCVSNAQRFYAPDALSGSLSKMPSTEEILDGEFEDIGGDATSMELATQMKTDELKARLEAAKAAEAGQQTDPPAAPSDINQAAHGELFGYPGEKRKK